MTAPRGPHDRPGRTRRLAGVLVATTLALAVAACGVDTDDTIPRTGSPGRPDSTDSSRGPGDGRDEGAAGTEPDELAWEPCDGDLECATLDVPLDHDDPHGATIELGLTRAPATDPQRRIGSLLVNPGGPGGSAVDLVGQLQLPDELHERFDVVGVDPRGVGRSTPLTCNTHLQAAYDADPTIDDPHDRAELLAASTALVDECEDEHADLLPHLGTRDVAHDMDLVRAALGEDQLTYLGYSYGTVIGQAYAQLYPERVRAMVLDGAVDLTTSGIDGAAGQARGFTRALDAFVDHCDRSGCDLDAPAATVIDEVVAAAETEPIPSASADRPATPGVVNLAIAYALYVDRFWPWLADALAQARDGDGSGLVELADAYLDRRADGTYEQGFETYFAVSCLDSAWPDDPDEILDAGREHGETYPLFGEAIVNDYVRCALWPVPPDPLEPVPADLEGLPPIVVVSTTGDPATPYEAGVAVADQIPGAVLVTNVGEGHTIVASGKGCIDRPITTYLLDGTPPADGLRCE